MDSWLDIVTFKGYRPFTQRTGREDINLEVTLQHLKHHINVFKFDVPTVLICVFLLLHK